MPWLVLFLLSCAFAADVSASNRRKIEGLSTSKSRKIKFSENFVYDPSRSAFRPVKCRLLAGKTEEILVDEQRDGKSIANDNDHAKIPILVSNFKSVDSIVDKDDSGSVDSIDDKDDCNSVEVQFSSNSESSGTSDASHDSSNSDNEGALGARETCDVEDHDPFPYKPPSSPKQDFLLMPTLILIVFGYFIAGSLSK